MLPRGGPATNLAILVLIVFTSIMVTSRPLTSSSSSSKVTQRRSYRSIPTFLVPGRGRVHFIERPERDLDDAEKADEIIDLSTTDRLDREETVREMRNELKETETEEADPETTKQLEPKLPESIKDGNYLYSLNNNTDEKEKARLAFFSLKPSEATLQILPSETRRVHGVHRHPNKNRKPGRRKDKVLVISESEERVQGRHKEMGNALTGPDSIHKGQVCESQKFKQRVKMAGCLTKVIVNRFCHGVCSSFFIPRLKAKKLKALFQSCAACTPKEYDLMDVTLDCPGQDPPQVTKTIIMVKKCECRNVDLSNMFAA